MRIKFLFASLLFATTAAAQSPAPPALPNDAPPVSRPTPRGEAQDWAAESLGQQLGMDRAAAKAFAARSRQLTQVLAAIEESNPAFAGAYLDHEGGTVLTVRYVGSPESLRSRMNIPPELSSSVRFVEAAVPLAALQGQQQRFLRSAQQIRLKVGTYIDTRNNRIVVTTEDLDRFRKERARGQLQVPENAEIRRQTLPDEVAATQPSGQYPVQSGNFIEGGRTIYQWNLANGTLTARPECTIGFVAKWNSTLGILTAGHCVPGNYGTGYFYSTGSSWVELWGLEYESDNVTTNYDYQFHRTPGFTHYATIMVKRESGAIDYLYVKGAQPRWYQTNGTPICKQGLATGFKCFSIKDNNFYYTNNAGYRTGPWVFVQAAVEIARGGDSGGPVTDFPSGSDVNARGLIHRAGPDAFSPNYFMYYMAIDQIDDVHPIQVWLGN